MKTLVLLICLTVLSAFGLGSGRMSRQSDSDLQNFENDGRRKQDAEDNRAQGESWNLDDGEDSDSQDEKRTDAQHMERSEFVSDFLGESDNTQENEPEMKYSLGNVERDTNSLVNGKNLIRGQRSKHRRQFKNHSARRNSKRHNRKLRDEIEELHSEVTLLAEDLGKISEKENELESEIDELKHPSKIHTKQTKRKDSSAKPFPRVTKDRHHNSHGDLPDEDDQLDSIETEIKDLEDYASESPLREEMKDLEKDIEETISKNNELRRKNEELCRLLQLSLIRQKDLKVLEATPENDDFYEELDQLSSDNGETLDDQFRKVCGRSHSAKKKGHRKKPKLNSSEDSKKNDETESEDSPIKDPHYEDEITRKNRKARKGRHFPKTLSTYQDKTESRRQAHDSSKMQKSEVKLHKIKLRDEENSENEAEEEIMLGNDTIKIDEVSSMTDHDDEDESLDKEDEVPLTIADDGEYSEEEANMTISMDDEDKQKVFDHIASVDEETFCGKPRPVVIYPSDRYPVPRKYYTPQGTILHRCSKHSGCCPNEHLTCVPAKKENVVLHFFAAVLDGSGTIVPHIERLHFVNHTKCGCVFKHQAHLYL